MKDLFYFINLYRRSDDTCIYSTYSEENKSYLEKEGNTQFKILSLI